VVGYHRFRSPSSWVKMASSWTPEAFVSYGVNIEEIDLYIFINSRIKNLILC